MESLKCEMENFIWYSTKMINQGKDLFILLKTKDIIKKYNKDVFAEYRCVSLNSLQI